jgi:hypothetical protein
VKSIPYSLSHSKISIKKNINGRQYYEFDVHGLISWITFACQLHRSIQMSILLLS